MSVCMLFLSSFHNVKIFLLCLLYRRAHVVFLGVSSCYVRDTRGKFHENSEKEHSPVLVLFIVTE